MEIARRSASGRPHNQRPRTRSPSAIAFAENSGHPADVVDEDVKITRERDHDEGQERNDGKNLERRMQSSGDRRQ